MVSGTSDLVVGAEGGGVGLQAVGAGGGLPLAAVLGGHAVAGFGDFSIDVAENRQTLRGQDGDQQKTRKARRHRTSG